MGEPLTYADIRKGGAEKPLYEALGDVFLAPHSLERGSTFRTWAPPSFVWKALNHTAEQMFEVWYNEETTMLDENGRKTKIPFKHHEKYRFKVTEPGESFDVEVVSGPPVVDTAKILSLAEAMYTGRPETDVRPAGISTRPMKSDDDADIEKPVATSIAEKAKARA